MNQRTRILLGATAALTLNASTYAIENGQAAPDCSLTRFDDAQRYQLSELRGRVVYVDFWASWCSACAQSFPFLNDLQRELGNQGFQVLGVNLDEKPEDTRNFLKKFPAQFAIAADAGGTCPRDFGVMGMPSSYLIDREGVVRHVHMGFRTGDAEQLRRLVKGLLSDTPVAVND
jgi:peroxiredoxin